MRTKSLFLSALTLAAVVSVLDSTARAGDKSAPPVYPDSTMAKDYMNYYDDLAPLVGKYRLLNESEGCKSALEITPGFGPGNVHFMSGTPTSLWIDHSTGFGTENTFTRLGWSDWAKYGPSFSDHPIDYILGNNTLKVAGGYFKSWDGYLSYVEYKKWEGKFSDGTQISMKRTGSTLEYYEAHGPTFDRAIRKCVYSALDSTGSKDDESASPPVADNNSNKTVPPEGTTGSDSAQAVKNVTVTVPTQTRIQE